MNRRQFIHAAAGTALLGLGRRALADSPVGRPKAPFRVLYGNDTTNLTNCISPYHRKGEPFRPQMLVDSVKEASAADVQLLQPGLTYVPLWKSRVYPADAHFLWWQKTFPTSPLDPLGHYMIGGGDILQVYVAACRAAKTQPFVSLRVNDYHGTEFLDVPPGTKMPGFESLTLDQFRRNHPEYRIQPPDPARGGMPWPGAAFKQRDVSVLDWNIPAVRERVLAFVTEVCEGYDIAGLELDFLRHYRLFKPGRTTREQRVGIVTAFVQQVRALLDRTERNGVHRWFSLRLPALPEVRDALGLDLPALARAGVEMMNLSMNYYTVQQGLDLAGLRRQAPDVAMYLEMTHVTDVGHDPKVTHGDSDFYRRTTREQFLSTANLAYARGFDGMSLFNLAYYRTYGHALLPPFGEPPFDILPRLADKAALATAPQHYFQGKGWHTSYGDKPPLPQIFSVNRKAAFHFDLVPPPGGWTQAGRLRIQSAAPFGPGDWRAWANGTELTVNRDTSEPYPNPYPQMLGTPETLRAWSVPPTLLKAGLNVFEIAGESATIDMIDLGIS